MCIRDSVFSLLPRIMLHAVDRDIRDEGDGVVVVLKRDIHILLIDIHVIRDDLDDVILEVVQDVYKRQILDWMMW